MNKKLIISLIILTALCTLGIFALLAGLFVASRTDIGKAILPIEQVNPTEDSEPTNQPPQPLDTPMPAIPPKIGNNAPSTLPAELALQMDEIQQQVSEIRGLRPDKPIIRALLTQNELQEKVENEFFKDYTAEDAQEDALILSALGLLPKDFDLIGLYKQLYAEQIAGYYDSETKEMYVVQGDEFAGIERMTYAHEFTHILQDQAYDLENGLKINDDYCEIETEYCSAVTALVEGDATYTEQDWLLSHSNSQDRQDIQNFYGTYTSPVFDSAPMYLQKDFLFPYQYGLEFVYSLTDRGGYDLVNQAYKNPPVTTEQILHPDKYPVESAKEISLPDLGTALPGKWEKVEENVLGEWYTFLVLAYGRETGFRLSEDAARKSAAGWGGDRYALYADPSNGKIVFVLKTRWDTDIDASEFMTSLMQYGQNRWGNPDRKDVNTAYWSSTYDGIISCARNGTDTVWLLAPDETSLQSIKSLFPEFPAQ